MGDIKDKAKSVRWGGLDRLAKTRDTTQAEMERGIFAESKKHGKDIQQVRGRRRPTEVYDSETGQWVKVMDLS